MSDMPHTADVNQLVMADDVAFYITAPTMAEAEEKMQQAVNRFKYWTVHWGLRINPKKTKLMCFTRRKIERPPVITIDGEIITYT